MRKLHKVAALCAVLIMAVCLFSTVAYAAPADGTDSTSTDTTTGGTISIPDGTGTVIASSTSGEKQFYTIQTPAGNTFYLIIDLSQKSNNVYFLDNVTEKDLLALAQKDSSTNAGTSSDNGTGGTAASPTATSSAAPASTSTQSSGPNFSMILLVVIIVVGGGAMFYVKVIRKKKRPDTRSEYEADDDEYTPEEPKADSDEYDAEPEDEPEAPPWQEDDE